MRRLRRHWALSQPELALLMGDLDPTALSRCETGRRFPTLPQLLRYQVIFGAPPATLFPDLYDAIEEDVVRRAALLSNRLEGRRDRPSAAKRRLLRAMIDRADANSRPL